MSESSDAAELEAYGNIDIFDGLYEYLILEGIGVAFSLAAFILIIYAAIKLNRGNNVPGARLIAASTILTTLFSLLYVSYTAIFEIEENAIAEAIINIVFGVLFFIGSIGFVRLCKYVVNPSANTAFKMDRAYRTVL